MSDNDPLPFVERAKIALIAFLQAFARVLIILVGAAVLGFLIYFGYVTVYKQAVLPARENADRISRLETRQAQNAPELATIEQRLSSLELQSRLNRQNLEAVGADQAHLQFELDQLIAGLQRLDNLQTQLDQIRAAADQAFIIGAQAYQETVGKKAEIKALERKIVLLKVASLLNRSRLYMVQSNFGLARDQVVMARALLSDLLESESAQQLELINEWIDRFDTAIGNLPGSPVTAADDLEIAWGSIIQGLPEPIIPTPTPYYYTPGDTPTPFATYTPTPYITSTPYISATPYHSPMP